ncbi:MAG: hypothetical protein ACE5KM_04465 [Planctomycetaceae bacterium]
MIQPITYCDLRGREIPLVGLDDDERKLVKQLKLRAAGKPDWNDFDNYRKKKVGDFYLKRGLDRSDITQTIPWKIGSDLSGRIAINRGLARMPDYRDELKQLIRERFPSRREFCKATGISEDMLSHVLARRKHLSIGTLHDALAKIGYTLRIEPLKPSDVE